MRRRVWEGKRGADIFVRTHYKYAHVPNLGGREGRGDAEPNPQPHTNLK